MFFLLLLHFPQIKVIFGKQVKPLMKKYNQEHIRPYVALSP